MARIRSDLRGLWYVVGRISHLRRIGLSQTRGPGRPAPWDSTCEGRPAPRGNAATQHQPSLPLGSDAESTHRTLN
jgi:hypothetical protein